MQNVYITRDGKKIQLTEDEIKTAWAAWDAETRKQQLETYKEEVDQDRKNLYDAGICTGYTAHNSISFRASAEVV